MRAHLLRTFYAAPAAEPDTGLAANDADYCGAAEDSAPLRDVARVPRSADAESRENEYALGGYAGI